MYVCLHFLVVLPTPNPFTVQDCWSSFRVRRLTSCLHVLRKSLSAKTFDYWLSNGKHAVVDLEVHNEMQLLIYCRDICFVFFAI